MINLLLLLLLLLLLCPRALFGGSAVTQRAHVRSQTHSTGAGEVLARMLTLSDV